MIDHALHCLVGASIIINIEHEVVGLAGNCGRTSTLFGLDLSFGILLGSIDALTLVLVHHWPHHDVLLSVIHKLARLDAVQLLQHLGEEVNSLVLGDIRGLRIIVWITADAAQHVLLREVLRIDQVCVLFLLIVLFVVILDILLVEAVLDREVVVVVLHVLMVKVGGRRIDDHVVFVCLLLLFFTVKLLKVDLALLVYLRTILVHCEVLGHE